MKRAVVLLSGGLDSTTTLAIAKEEGFDVLALSFRYGQRHEIELDCATHIAASYGVRHVICHIDLRSVGGSALTSDLAVPKRRSADEIGDGIPVTYVPARNTIFLSFALAWCEAFDASDIFIGINAIDYSGYPDCRPEFIRAFEEVARLGTKAGVEGRPARIHTPLISMTKAQIIATGIRLGVDYAKTSTCYEPRNDGAACGLCDACLLRLNGFAEAGVRDPVAYQGSI
jgi:7-cyano-7-deazaguanine synthase